MPLTVSVVLVFAESPEVARKWIAAHQRPGVIFAYAYRWSSIVGRNRESTFWARVGEWWRIESNEEAIWWAKDNGYQEWSCELLDRDL